MQAKTANGEDVTREAMWRSSDSSIATVSVSGLVSALAAGTVEVSAAYAGAIGTLSIGVTAPDLVGTRIASCGTIAHAGTYVLTSDIETLPSVIGCLTITGAGVMLDCQGHSVQSIKLDHASAGSVVNCVIPAGPNLAKPNLLQADTLSDELFEHDTLGGVAFSNGTGVTFRQNTVSPGPLIGTKMSGTRIVDNMIDLTTALLTTTGIYLEFGVNEEISRNVIEGHWPGSGDFPDDGILLASETNALIDGNTVRDFLDAGVETMGLLANSTISNNLFVHVHDAGIGSYWGTYWQGNQIVNNVADGSDGLFVLTDDHAKPGYAPLDAFVLTDNQFADNRLASSPDPNLRSADFEFLRAGDLVHGNLVRGNDFGVSNAPPIFNPLSGFINGGGNICSEGGFSCGAAPQLAIPLRDLRTLVSVGHRRPARVTQPR
jgi:hypothetical protein